MAVPHLRGIGLVALLGGLALADAAESLSAPQEAKTSGEKAQQEELRDAVRAGRATPRPAAAKPSRDFGDGGKADDAIRRVLLDGPEAPEDIFELLRRLRAHGGELKPHLVVNGGHENPARTRRNREKFMCFATYANATPGKTIEEDELFLGFFLGTAYLDACAKAAGTLDSVVDWLKAAAQRRQEIVAAETSKHPQGGIIETGFRVIFPDFEKVHPKVGQLRLDSRSGRATPSEGAGD